MLTGLPKNQIDSSYNTYPSPNDPRVMGCNRFGILFLPAR